MWWVVTLPSFPMLFYSPCSSTLPHSPPCPFIICSVIHFSRFLSLVYYPIPVFSHFKTTILKSSLHCPLYFYMSSPTSLSPFLLLLSTDTQLHFYHLMFQNNHFFALFFQFFLHPFFCTQVAFP